MLKKQRPHLTYANVVSSLCLFIILAGGTAYAANTIGSDDIIDESIVSADIKNYGVKRSDIGLNSINSDPIENGAITSPDIGLNAVTGGNVLNSTLDGTKVLNNSLTGDDIADFSLNDEDVGQGAFVKFAADIGTVPAHSCVSRLIHGMGAQGDHLLLTPSLAGADIIYAIQYSSGAEYAYLQACNVAAYPSNVGDEQFNLLVIDAY